MINSLSWFSHGECGGSLSLYAGEIYCVNCGHLHLEDVQEIDFDDFSSWLPYLVQSGVIDKNDFTGLALKQV